MGKKINREAAISALLVSPTFNQAAECVGISEKTMHQWMRNEAFSKAVQDAQDKINQAAIRRMISSIGMVLDALERVFKDCCTPPAPKVSAARTVLEQALRAYDLQHIDKRLIALERKQSEEVRSKVAKARGENK